jgi:hypothetical protein
MKKYILILLLMFPLLAMSQPATQNISDLYNMSFGKYGCLNVNDDSWHTGKWGIFQADTSTVIDTVVFRNYNTTTRNWVNDSAFNWHLVAGTSKYWGSIIKIKLVSGRGTLHNEKQ